MFRIILCFIIAFAVTVPDIVSSQQVKEVSITGGDSWQQSVTSLVREEVSMLKKGDILRMVIESENKSFVTFPIKMYELPVTIEGEAEKDLTRFTIRLK